VSTITHDGRTMRMLTMINENTRECLAIRVARQLGSYEVIEALADVTLWREVPENIRSDKGPQFVATELRKMADESGDRISVHRSWQSMRERLLRELQREAAV
jgi:putative transposase